jgi:hypothetical protein
MTKVVGDLHVYTRRANRGDYAESSVSIAAGCIDSDIHKADIKITYAPDTDVQVTVEGGDGYNLYASLDIDGNTLYPGDTQTVTTDENGELYGTLWSSDLLADNVTISVCDPNVDNSPNVDRTANLVWDNYGGNDAWVSTDNQTPDDGDVKTSGKATFFL